MLTEYTPSQMHLNSQLQRSQAISQSDKLAKHCIITLRNPRMILIMILQSYGRTVVLGAHPCLLYYRNTALFIWRTLVTPSITIHSHGIHKPMFYMSSSLQVLDIPQYQTPSNSIQMMSSLVKTSSKLQLVFTKSFRLTKPMNYG